MDFTKKYNLYIDFRWHLLYPYNTDFFAPIFPTSSIVLVNTMQSLMTWCFHEASSEVFRSVVRVLDLGELDNSQLFWPPLWRLFFWKFFAYFFPEDLVEKLAFFKTLDHLIPKTAWLTSVKFWNMNICLNLSNFS